MEIVRRADGGVSFRDLDAKDVVLLMKSVEHLRFRPVTAALVRAGVVKPVVNPVAEALRESAATLGRP